MKIWHKENSKLLDIVKISIDKHFPTLHIIFENDVMFIRGALHLTEINDFYSIEIELSHSYPDKLPFVRETGGRIPHIGERHIFMNGNCCLFVEEETWRYYPKGMSLVEFIQKIVMGYFMNQSYFEHTGKWLWGDRSHGISGILEFYKEELKTNDLKLIYAFIEYLAKETLKKHRICYCGSNKKLQDCHFLQLKDYREKIKTDTARMSLHLFDVELEKYKQLRFAEQRKLEGQILNRNLFGIKTIYP